MLYVDIFKMGSSFSWYIKFFLASNLHISSFHDVYHFNFESKSQFIALLCEIRKLVLVGLLLPTQHLIAKFCTQNKSNINY